MLQVKSTCVVSIFFGILLNISACLAVTTDTFPEWVAFTPQQHGESPYKGTFKVTTSGTVTLHKCTVNNETISCDAFSKGKGYSITKKNPLNFIIKDWSAGDTGGSITFRNNDGPLCIFKISKIKLDKLDKYDLTRSGKCEPNWLPKSGTPTFNLLLHY